MITIVAENAKIDLAEGDIYQLKDDCVYIYFYSKKRLRIIPLSKIHYIEEDLAANVKPLAYTQA
jgi:hypothetical protein